MSLNIPDATLSLWANNLTPTELLNRLIQDQTCSYAMGVLLSGIVDLLEAQQDDLEQMTQERDILGNQLVEAEDEVYELQSEVDDLSDKVVDLEDKIESLEADKE